MSDNEKVMWHIVDLENGEIHGPADIFQSLTVEENRFLRDLHVKYKLVITLDRQETTEND